MVSEEDLNSAGFKESDDGNDGQRRGANEESGDDICQTIGLIRQSYASSRNSRSASIGGNSAMNIGVRITGKTVRIHISSRMARELIAIYQTMYHLWFLESQRVLPQQRLHLPRHHLHLKSQHRLTVIHRKTEMLRLQYPEGIERGMNEELRGDPLHDSAETEKQNKNRESEEVQREKSHELPDWLQELRENLVV